MTATPASRPAPEYSPGICTSCGLGFRPRFKYALTCYACWSSGHNPRTVLDPRAEQRPAGRIVYDFAGNEALRASAPANDHAGRLPRHTDGTVPAARANLRADVTRRLAAAVRRRQAIERAAEYDRTRAMGWINAIAYDLHHTPSVNL